MPEQHGVEEHPERRRGHDDGEDGGRQDGPAVLRVQEVVEAGDEEGHGAEGEVQDARRRVGDDQAGGADRVDPSQHQSGDHELEHPCGPLLTGRLRRGVSDIDVDSDTNDADVPRARRTKCRLTWVRWHSAGAASVGSGFLAAPPDPSSPRSRCGPPRRRRRRLAGCAPKAPRSATITTASMSTSPNCHGRRGSGTIRRRPQSRADGGERSQPGVLQRGIDPDADHRRLARLRGVVAAEPAAQVRAVGSRQVGDPHEGVGDGAHRLHRQHDGQLVLVLEVAVEDTVRDAGGGGQVVHPGGVIAPLRRRRHGRSPPMPSGRRACRCPTRIASSFSHHGADHRARIPRGAEAGTVLVRAR